MTPEAHGINVPSAEQAPDLAGGDTGASRPGDRTLSEEAASELDRRAEAVARAVPAGGVSTSRIVSIAVAATLAVVSAGVVASRVVTARRERERGWKRWRGQAADGWRRIRRALPL